MQAQHESQQQNCISPATHEMDKEAKEGAKGKGTPLHLPHMWTNMAADLPCVNDEVIIDTKRYLLQQPTSALRSDESDETPTPRDRTWTTVFPEAKEAQRAWQRLQPLNNRDWGEIRTWSLYAEAAGWKWEGKQQHYDKCGLWCESVRHHKLHECIATKTWTYKWVQEVYQIFIGEGVHAGHITPTWGDYAYKGSNKWT